MDSVAITDAQTSVCTDSFDVTVAVKKKKKNCNKLVHCKFCGHRLRQDNVKRHMRTHEQVKQIKKVAEIAAAEGASSSCYEQSFPNTSIATFDEEMLEYNKIYLDKIDMGKQIHEALIKGTVMEDALPKKCRESVDIFRKSFRPIDLLDVELRPWQQELVEKIKVPTEREIIWVKGIHGNEGKTYFQKYIRSLFGYSRVAMLDLKSKTANIMHGLRKCPLTTVDIFFFNDARAVNNECRCYMALEHIKDGSGFASKFNSKCIQFKTPNIVVVFSNSDPDMKQLSQDRWKVYYITREGLSSQEERLWKARNKRTGHSNFGRDSIDLHLD